MAFELTTRARLLSERTNVEPNIILEIDGIPYVFGAIEVTRLLRYGDNVTYGDGNVYGGVVKDPSSLDWISLGGTTTSIKQQVEPDKASANSVQSIKITMIDKNAQLTNWLMPGQLVDDVLSRDASVYLAFKGGDHPTDSIKILQGLVSDLSFNQGSVKVTVSHPDQLKRKEAFIETAAETTGSITSGSTTISLDKVDNLLLDQDAITTYVQIEDEVIKYAGISGLDLIGCVRGQLGTTAVSHDSEAEVKSFYRMQGNTIDLSLKLLLSDGANTPSYTGVSVTQFNQLDASTFIQDAIFFPDYEDIETELGLTSGDLISITGATNLANNVLDAPIAGFGKLSTGSYLILSGVSLVSEINSTATCSLNSKYNVLPDGAGMRMNQVDVPQFEQIDALFSSSFPDYDFYIKETMKVKEFLDQEILFPTGIYSIPRKGKASCNIMVPPIAQLETKVINTINVTNAEKLSISRSINKNFYNAVVYKYEEQANDDKFLAGIITQSPDSTERIRVGNRPLTIESKGLRRNAVTDNLIEVNTRRLLDRFQFAAEEIKVDVHYKTGFNQEIGDTVIFGQNTQVSDSKNGTRNFQDRIFEIKNKSLNYKTGKINLTLLDTAFSLDGRYTTFSPSSYIDPISTGSNLTLIKSFGTGEFEQERAKWTQYIGQNIIVRDCDFTVSHEAKITGFSNQDPNVLIIDPALPFAIGADYILEAPSYPLTTDSTDNSLWKTLHASFNPSIVITSGASGTQFDVGASDLPKLQVGQILLVHNEDYSELSEETKIADITGATITVEDDLGFTPSSSTHNMELIAFLDGEAPYRYL